MKSFTDVINLLNKQTYLDKVKCAVVAASLAVMNAGPVSDRAASYNRKRELYAKQTINGNFQVMNIARLVAINNQSIIETSADADFLSAVQAVYDIASGVDSTDGTPPSDPPPAS